MISTVLSLKEVIYFSPPAAQIDPALGHRTV